MAEQKTVEQPIVIKRITGGHGHHGGSWKVAFADFATAMMAFFLLMWILGQTDQQQQATISNYFNNPNAVDMGGSSGVTGPEPGIGEGELDPESASPATHAAAEETEQLEQLQADVEQTLESLQSMEAFQDRVKVEMTPEGMRIQIMDRENKLMFPSGSSTLEPDAAGLIRELAAVIAGVPNRISISGHTDATPYGSSAYSNWELSTDRAHSARREFIRGGLAAGRIGRVVGLADQALLVPEAPTDPTNRRITILVMNRQTEEAIRREGGQLVHVED
jgi:chemotaxis protein MotB